MSHPRPPAPVRYLVLFAALVLLTCVVCARQRVDGTTPTPTARSTPAATATQAAPEPDAVVAAPADAGVATEPPPEVFPATKAPGKLF